MLYIVQEEIRRAVGKGEESKMKLALEQPADPSHYVPEVVSFWGTKEWRKLQNMYQLQEQTFRQSSFGGRKVKPTTFGGDLRLCAPQLHEEIQEEEVKRSIPRLRLLKEKKNSGQR